MTSSASPTAPEPTTGPPGRTTGNGVPNGSSVPRAPYTIVRPGWFDYNGPDEHRLVLLQGDTRQAGDSSDGVIARRQIAEVLVRSLNSPGAAQNLGSVADDEPPRHPSNLDARCSRSSRPTAGRAGHIKRRPNVAPQSVREDLRAQLERTRSPMSNVIVVDWTGPDRPHSGTVGSASTCWPTCAEENANANQDPRQRRLRRERRDGRRVQPRGRPGTNRTSHRLGEMTGLIHAAGVSVAGVAGERVKVRYGAALVSSSTETPGGSASSSRRSPGAASALTAEQNQALATTPLEDLLDLRSLPARPGTRLPARLPARQARQRATRDGRGGAHWGKRGAPLNTITGIVITLASQGQVHRPRGAGYEERRRSSRSRWGAPARPTSGAVGALHAAPDGGFHSGAS